MLKIFSETLVILVTSNCELFQGKIEKLGCSVAQNGNWQEQRLTVAHIFEIA